MKALKICECELSGVMMGEYYTGTRDVSTLFTEWRSSSSFGDKVYDDEGKGKDE